MGWFGASVKRKEDPALLTGRGRFVDDIELPGMLHAVVLRSPHAPRRDPRHRQERGARAARRARGVHLCRPAGIDAARRPCRCWCRARRSSRRSCRTASPRTRSASSASRSRSWSRTAATSPRTPRAGRCRLRAAAGGVRSARKGLAAGRAARASRLAQQSRRASSRSRSATPTRAFAQARACLPREDLPASRRAVLHGMPRRDRGAGRGRPTR